MAYKRKIITYENRGFIILKNTNANCINNQNIVLIFDEKNRLVVENNRRFFYNDNDQLIKMEFSEIVEPFETKYFETHFEYFNNKILAKNILISSSIDDNDIYFIDGKMVHNVKHKKNNEILSIETISLDEISKFINLDISFINEIKNDYYEFANKESEIIIEEIDEFDKFIITRENHGNNNENDYYSSFTITIRKYKRFIIEDFEVYKLIELQRKQNENDLNPIIEYFNYDYNGVINYFENEYYISTIDTVKATENERIEIGFIIDKQKKTFEKWYQTTQDFIENLNYIY